VVAVVAAAGAAAAVVVVVLGTLRRSRADFCSPPFARQTSRGPPDDSWTATGDERLKLELETTTTATTMTIMTFGRAAFVWRV
jgi:hypothetical protein